MTFDEKRDLCGSMNKLPGKALARAVSLIHERVPKVCYIPEIIPGMCTHYPRYIADLGHAFVEYIPVMCTQDPHAGQAVLQNGDDPDADIDADMYLHSIYVYIYIYVCVCVFTCIYKFANDVFDDDGLSRRLAHLSS